MVYTTTTNINLTEEGIVINQFFSRSALKKAYLYEQSNTMNHLGNGNNISLLLDLSTINVSMDEITQLIQDEKSNPIKSLAIVIASKPQKELLKLWYKLKKLNFPIQFFNQKEDAKLWLKASF